MLSVLPRPINDLFRICNVSYSSQLLVLRTGFLLYSTYVLPALRHLQNVVDIGHSVNCSFLHLTFHFQDLFRISHVQHQQKNIPFGWNGSVRVDALRQNRQRHPGGGLLRAWRQYNASRCISPSDRCFTVPSRSVGLLF
jgi:hypothetical protein